MISEQVKQICHKIGMFYLEKMNGNYDAAREEVDRLRIESIEIKEVKIKQSRDPGIEVTTSGPIIVETVVITLPMVGLLIGRRGENIDNLSKYLQMPVKVIESPDYLTWHLHYPINERESIEHYGGG